MRITEYSVVNKELLPTLRENKHVDTSVDSISLPEDLYEFFCDIYFADVLAEEHAWIVAMNTKNIITGVFEISHGSVNYSIVNPREIFIRLLLSGAVSFIMVHNHPSGNPDPSKEDIDMTTKLKKISEMMGIQFLDHVIIGEKRFFSFNKEHIM